MEAANFPPRIPVYPRLQFKTGGTLQKLISFLLAISIFLPQLALAESEILTTSGKRLKIVGKSALYGFAGGAVVGVASQVFVKKTKNIFLFGSLGLYAGIALGIYVITSVRGPTPYEGPDTYQDFGDYSTSIESSRAYRLTKLDEPKVVNPAQLEVNFLNISF